MNKNIYISAILVTLVVLTVLPLQAQSEIDIALYANATVYPNPAYDSVSLLEFPFSVNRDDFEFYKPDSNDSRFLARIFVQVDLLGTTGFPVDSSSTYFSVMANSLVESKKSGYRIFNKLKMFAKPGIYAARITVIDVVNKNKGLFYIDKIIVEPTQTEKIQLGGINLAYNISYVGEDGINTVPFTYKNGYNITVNPICVYAHTDSIAFLYGEVYNLVYDIDKPMKYNLSLNILNENGSLFKFIGSKSKQKPGTSAVFTESFDISDIPLGNYHVQIMAADLETRTVDTLLYPLRIISTDEILAKAEMVKDFNDPYAKLSLKQKKQLVTYQLFDNDLKALNQLTDEGQENFLEAFWRDKDESPSTPVNEYRIEQMRRFEYCMKNFSTNDLQNNGWLTDRARIYMKYGHYDERDDHEAPRTGNAFVVWYFNAIQGGLTFIFEDLAGDDDYRLVHSNAIGEVYNDKWAERLRSGFLEFSDN